MIITLLKYRQLLPYRHSNSDNVLLHILQDTVYPVSLGSSGQENPTFSRYMHPLFIECAVGTLSYLDDNGNTPDLKHTLDSKLTVGSIVIPAYYASNRSITLGCALPTPFMIVESFYMGQK